ncbi:ras-like protein family member 10A isoform X2 [Rhinolophus ferrumequinum]|uniref:ras-like protein family member 10A isoform X2 n=1 Tax=Rhinolophus ferrumequinum TaxID=59479 RepID=UPI00140F79DF|nr:ras-like protein family member 10A isoform X2 [Rhinolophus ferrumequinum]
MKTHPMLWRNTLWWPSPSPWRMHALPTSRFSSSSLLYFPQDGEWMFVLLQFLDPMCSRTFPPKEWLDPKDWSLQDTDAFVLVYDICSPDSFDYVKSLRQRIAETRPAGAPEAPILVVGNKRDRQRLRFGPRRALATLVRRGWRCGYLECSAKYNWHVLRLFRELLRCALVRARPAHPALRLQGALHPARCSLM